MGEEANQIFRYMKMKKMDSNEASISSFENSENSIDSISSSDLIEDATSPWSSSNGPLYELSEIMAQLPIKRGLSKHYHGKSQSFPSLANVRSIEDFPKKVVPFCIRAKMKTCKRYGWRMDYDHHNKRFSPKATISKKGSCRVCFMSSLAR